MLSHILNGTHKCSCIHKAHTVHFKSKWAQTMEKMLGSTACAVSNLSKKKVKSSASSRHWGMKSMKSKISMMMAPADVSEGTWTWTEWREQWSQNQHDDGPCQCQWRHLNMDRMKRTMKAKISMMMAPADVSEGTWTWTEWREQWRPKSAWWWPLPMSVRAPEHGQNEENNEGQNQHDDGPCRCQWGHLNMDRMKDKISMTTAPADVSKGTWTWREWREQWRTKSAWCQWGHWLRTERTVNDKISMMMAPTNVREVIWTWTVWRVWRVKSAWWWLLLTSGRALKHGQNEDYEE